MRKGEVVRYQYTRNLNGFHRCPLWRTFPIKHRSKCSMSRAISENRSKHLRTTTRARAHKFLYTIFFFAYECSPLALCRCSFIICFLSP